MRHVTDYGPAPLDEPRAYPGTWPTGPVVVDDDEVRALPADPPTAGRTPVVAIGSNACPAQIQRKALGGPVVLTPTTLRHHLVAYAGHLTSYGAVPATVIRWSSASCAVFISWLTDAQHAVMDATEGSNYERILVPTDDGRLPAYRAVTGLTRDRSDAPIRIAGIATTGRSLPVAMSQPEVLDLRSSTG